MLRRLPASRLACVRALLHVYFASVQAQSVPPPFLPPNAPPTTPVFTVTSGTQYCHTSIDGMCVTDDPVSTTGSYGNNERCTIRMDAAATLTATEFNTESGFDFFYVRSARYDGTRGPIGVAVAAGDTLAWYTDSSAIRSGALHAA